MMTFLAPPAMCLPASAAFVKRPVDSMTMSTPRSPQGRFAGSRSSKTLMALPLTVMESASYETSASRRPPTESYLRRSHPAREPRGGSYVRCGRSR
ncbi:MAG: hypothetical protein ABS62_09645 [Microbacterium sp. SCN 70-200]|nr:MAG: hypothetical protein ABS62_09645 [Microbacterium sp. SCN 70-200]